MFPHYTSKQAAISAPLRIQNIHYHNVIRKKFLHHCIESLLLVHIFPILGRKFQVNILSDTVSLDGSLTHRKGSTFHRSVTLPMIAIYGIRFEIEGSEHCGEPQYQLRGAIAQFQNPIIQK